jgi:acetolactate synthase-1/2/3 large subunit
MLAGLKHLILVEAPPPVSFFHYPGRRSELAPQDCTLHVLASIGEDGTEALEALVGECGAVNAPWPTAAQPGRELPRNAPLTPEAIGAVLGALIPEGAILCDEMVSSGYAVMSNVATSVAYDFLPVTGGSIGQCLPVAVGAAVASPDRKVIALEADGSGMYTFQALWTMARERLNIVTVIFANRRYRILDIEMRRTGAYSIGPKANEMMDLTHPEIDWVRLSESLHVPATRATTTDEFVARFRRALEDTGPSLIEAVIP